MEASKQVSLGSKSLDGGEKSGSKDPLRSIAEASAWWGVKQATVRKRLARRDCGYVKIGRRVLIPESEILRIIAEGTVPALAK